jgi:polyhydroxybutyrate depolymerase
VPVLHFHGDADPIVPFKPATTKPSFTRLKSVDDSIKTWVKLDGCDEKPTTDVLSKNGDDMKVTRQTYGGGKDGSEVVLVTVEGGGHTWPGQKPPVEFIGKSAMNISADDLMWEFFQKHPMK